MNTTTQSIKKATLLAPQLVTRYTQGCMMGVRAVTYIVLKILFRLYGRDMKCSAHCGPEREEKMSRKEELQRQLKALHEELNTITDAENDARDATYVGKCFRTRNNYSCPKSEKDYWWLYLKVLRADTGLYCLRFQIDCNGRIEIEPEAYMTANSLDRYTPMKPADFDKAWKRCVLAVSAAQ